VLALLVALMFVGALLRLPETLPPSARHGGGLRTLLGNAGQVLRNRAFVGYLLTNVGAFGALFAYISASPFVIQDVLGLSPQGYGLVFGANALGLVLAGALCVRLVGRVPTRTLLAIGLGGLWVATLALLVGIWLGPWLWLTLVLMWLAVTSLGLVFGNASSLALGSVGHSRGTASAFLGSCQFAIGAAVSPLVGLGGKLDARPMAVVMFAGACLAGAALRGVVRAGGRSAPSA
jgi:DHA1 family bicyclomycin/chloramphenicol resistance-like MFS transporter